MDCKVFYKDGKILHQINVSGEEDVSEAFLQVEAYLYNMKESWNKPMLAVLDGEK